MIRNLKASGLALCAVFILSALSASAASAANDLLTSASGSGTTYLTGTQIGGIGAGNVFGTKSRAGKIECATGTFTGTFTGTSASEGEISPSLTGCKIGAANATVDNEGCKLVISGQTDPYTNTNGQAEGEDATASLNCADTGQIRVTGPLGCIITFSDTHPAGTKVNQNLQGGRSDNEVGGGKWDVKVTLTVDKITYTANANCQSLGFTATDSDAFLTGNVTVKAYEDAAHTKQVNLTSS